MNEKKIIFYISIIALFVFAMCYFSTSRIDGRRSEELGARIDDCQNLNSELQAGTGKLQQTTADSQREVEAAIRGLGNAEAELDRAASAIERCQQILRTAERRTQEANQKDK